jgi:hypothetical protein
MRHHVIDPFPTLLCRETHPRCNMVDRYHPAAIRGQSEARLRIRILVKHDRLGSATSSAQHPPRARPAA